MHLIRKNEVNIYDIPIALITEQYLGYIELMQELNLDVAGEFLVMAATLIHIKSRTLLPRPDPAQDDAGPEEDPREALVRRLLEHQKYKAAAELLHDRETLRSAQFMRPDAQRGRGGRRRLRARARSRPLQPAGGVPRRARAREPAAARWCCRRSRSRSRTASHQLLGRLSETEACGFEDLFADGDGSRPFMIVTFLALLEMIRLKLIRVFQSGGFGADPRLQARAAGRRAAPDRRSARLIDGHMSQLPDRARLPKPTRRAAERR